MTTGIEPLAPGELPSRVLALKGEERIFIQIEENMARDMRYILNKKDGMDNIFLSYINKTTEQANPEYLEMFIDRAAKLELEKQEKFAEIGYKYMGKDLYEYLQDNLTGHAFTVDPDRKLLVIHATNVTGLGFEPCGCGGSNCSL